jgi:hypothetical protein
MTAAWYAVAATWVTKTRMPHGITTSPNSLGLTLMPLSHTTCG